jgi:large subunit ribosomal protein L21
VQPYARNHRNRGKQYKVAEGDVLSSKSCPPMPAMPSSLTRSWPYWTATTRPSALPSSPEPPLKLGGQKRQGKEVMIFKYNPKKGYRKRQGHRQPYTKVEIGKIRAKAKQ